MNKTKIMIVTPCDIGDRVSVDLNIELTIREEAREEFLFAKNAFRRLDFCEACFSKISQSRMDELIDEIKTDWPDAAYVIYPHAHSLCFEHLGVYSSWLYTHPDDSRRRRLLDDPKGETVSIGYFIRAMRAFGVIPLPVSMDIGGPFGDEITIRSNYGAIIDEIARLPRAKFEQDRVCLPAVQDSLYGLLTSIDTKESMEASIACLTDVLRSHGYSVERAPVSGNETIHLLTITQPECFCNRPPLLNCAWNDQEKRLETHICQRLLLQGEDQIETNGKVVAVCHQAGQMSVYETTLPASELKALSEWLPKA